MQINQNGSCFAEKTTAHFHPSNTPWTNRNGPLLGNQRGAHVPRYINAHVFIHSFAPTQ